MSDKTKEQLKKAYANATAQLEIIEKQRKELLMPTHDRWWAAVQAQGDAGEALDSHVIGNCEGCLEVILDGEPNYHDGENYNCINCAPKAGNALDQLLEAGEEAYNWFDEGKKACLIYIDYLKSLPREQSLASE